MLRSRAKPMASHVSAHLIVNSRQHVIEENKVFDLSQVQQRMNDELSQNGGCFYMVANWIISSQKC